MSYLTFLIFFIGIPLTLLTVYFCRCQSNNKKINLIGIVALCFLAVIYTTPWDNYLVANNIWWYGQGRVIFTIGYVPFEEYLFFITQTLLTGFWTFLITNKIKLNFVRIEQKTSYIAVSMALFAILALGIISLFNSRSLYQGLILTWGTPIVILQFLIGGRYLLNNLKPFTIALLPPTLYLWIIDHYAISQEIWTISTEYTLGIKIGVLPQEEMIFFLITNIMISQGLILLNSMKYDIQFIRRRIIE